MRKWDWGALPGLPARLNERLKALSGEVNRGYRTKAVTAAYTVMWADELVLASGTFTVTLPPAALVRGHRVIIKNIGSGTITVDGNGSETIDDATTFALVSMLTLEIVSDGTEWWRI